MRVLRAVAAIGLALALGFSTMASSEAKPNPGTPDHYSPQSGPTFNNPYGPFTSERANFRHLLRTINTVRRGQKIRIASWNVRSRVMADAVIAAHHRGVSVRIVMDRVNATAGTPNRDVTRIKNELSKHNKNRRPKMTSWLRKCISSCRAQSGIAHTKFYLFSKVGKKRKYVTMFGSNNLTELAASIQWNDLYTFAKRKDIYKEFDGVFQEMAKDRKVQGGGYRHFKHGSFDLFFYPYTGKAAERNGDPDMNRLNAVRCRGATGGAGLNGRTKIRIAQTAMYGNRGVALANRLATMKRRGCNIRIVYAMFGNEVLRILRNANIGLTHLAWDRNEDGIYDRYVHMKSMTISGVYRKKTDARVTVNGSANLTSVALASDEVVGEFRNRKLTARYAGWIDFLFTHRPKSWGPDGPGSADAPARTAFGADPFGLEYDRIVQKRARANGVDPYALIKQDM